MITVIVLIIIALTAIFVLLPLLPYLLGAFIAYIIFSSPLFMYVAFAVVLLGLFAPTKKDK